jgi:methionyl-tRNA formyltransferase
VTERARTIFLGSGSFAVPIVEALADHPSVDLIAVVTAPTRAGSRGRPTDPPVAEWASVRGLPMIRPVRLRDAESAGEIAALAPDLLVLADFGQIVPASLLSLPPRGALNLHPSLLPRHRGSTPIPAAILAGDSETGVSLMQMDAGLDTGPVIAQAVRPMRGDETSPDLEADLAQAAAALVQRTIDDWLGGLLQASPQPAEGATLTRPLRREDGRLDPMQPAEVLERQVRAYQPWPGTFLETDHGRINVWKSGVLPSTGGERGTLVRLEDGGLGLTTAQDALELVEVQPAGGRRMTGRELLRGRPNLVGSRVLGRSAAANDASA